MRHIFKFPDIGEGLEEGTIAEWYVEKGQEVEVGQALVKMETDKVVTDIPSPKNGIIAEIYGKPGETINVGDALVEIDLGGEAENVNQPDAETQKQEAVEEEGAGVVGTLEVAGSGGYLPASEEGVNEDEQSENKPKKKALATPVARAIAKDLGIDINRVIGTGPAGRVMKQDIYDYSDKKPSSAPASNKTSVQTEEQLVESVPLTQLRKTIAKNMIRSKHNAAHMAVFDDVEVSELIRLRKKYKEPFAEDGIKLSYLPFILKATAFALKKYKALNSEMDTERDRMLYKKYYNIGIAVDTEAGLVVPVIKNVDKLSIKEIAAKVNEFAEKARRNELTMEDMQDGTFTITAYGSIGGQYAFPVINYPQAAILGIGKIMQKPVVKNNEVVPGNILPLSLAVDHRIVDGGEVTRFLNQIIEYLNDPISLIMA